MTKAKSKNCYPSQTTHTTGTPHVSNSRKPVPCIGSKTREYRESHVIMPIAIDSVSIHIEGMVQKKAN